MCKINVWALSHIDYHTILPTTEHNGANKMNVIHRQKCRLTSLKKVLQYPDERKQPKMFTPGSCYGVGW